MVQGQDQVLETEAHARLILLRYSRAALADDFGLGKWTKADRHPTFGGNQWEFS
jgi:hypothetical protein